jgi:hypothetical protein
VVAGSGTGNTFAAVGAGLAGKYSAPVWPQPAKVDNPAPRTIELTRICFVINMVKL